MLASLTAESILFLRFKSLKHTWIQLPLESCFLSLIRKCHRMLHPSYQKNAPSVSSCIFPERRFSETLVFIIGLIYSEKKGLVCFVYFLRPEQFVVHMFNFLILILVCYRFITLIREFVNPKPYQPTPRRKESP